jgi:hypothetical protein
VFRSLGLNPLTCAELIILRSLDHMRLLRLLHETHVHSLVAEVDELVGPDLPAAPPAA